MGILEIVFNSRKFDLNDDVLMGFDNYFDKKSKDYNSFCLDEEDINPLQNFVAQIKSADSDSVIYVSTYGYEITNSKGEKSTYADALWIDTVLPISQIERYIEKSGVAEPSNISFVGDSDECGNYKVWIIAQEENNPHIIELTDRKKIDHMIILYPCFSRSSTSSEMVPLANSSISHSTRLETLSSSSQAFNAVAVCSQRALLLARLSIN